jgi:hypothetical protein
MSYRTFFGLSVEPFRAELTLEQVLTTPELLGVQQRLDYFLRLGVTMLVIAELNHSSFTDQAVAAIHQGSGGLFRKANHLAHGAMIAAVAEKTHEVTPEHVQYADSELR